MEVRKMKSVILACLVASLCIGTVTAQDLGTSRELPVKNTPIVIYVPPAVPMQGGDTIGDATSIPGLPYSNTGTTEGYLDDYDEICPYDTPGSPDVVYSFTPDSDVQIDVDLCGSSYDTKTYIYDADLNLIACNDDAYFDDVCGVYVSKIENAALFGGNTYYIVIDGYGGDAGDYVLLVDGYEPCIFVGCPADAVDEGEPPLEDGYTDLYNSGCSSPEPGDHFQEINWTNVDPSSPWNGHAWLCGVSGWYVASSGGSNRDTDWFRVYALQAGMMEVTVESEHPLYIFKLAPLDCANMGIELSATADCEAPATLTFPVTAGEEIWLFTAPTTFEGPVTEFTYFMTVSNNTFDTVPSEGMSWGQVKSLYR
jgi:hypothetical protein